MSSEKPNLDQFDGEELQAFVAETLQAIVLGIASADGALAPPARTSFSGGTPMKHQFRFSKPKEVHFDVAVTVNRRAGGKGGMKLQILSVGAGAEGEKSKESSIASRVSFAVPIYDRGSS